MSQKVEGLGESHKFLKKMYGGKLKGCKPEDNAVYMDEKDIKNILKDCTKTDFYRFGIVQLGKNMDKIFGDDIKVKGVAIQVFGGTELSIRECQEIIEAFAEKAGHKAKILWGASCNKKQKRMEISVMVGR